MPGGRSIYLPLYILTSIINVNIYYCRRKILPAALTHRLPIPALNRREERAAQNRIMKSHMEFYTGRGVR